MVSTGERPFGEDLDVARFVVDMAAEPQDQLNELRVDLRQEPGGHVQGGVFVLSQERHDLRHGPLGRVIQALGGLPGDVAGGVPLLGGRLVDELADVVGPDRVAAAERPVVCGCSGLGDGSEGSKTGTRIGLGREGSAAPVSGAQLSVTKGRRRLARWERSRQDSGRGATAYRDDVSVRSG